MLKVDLSNRKISTDEIEEDDLRSLVGGAGYAENYYAGKLSQR